MSVILQKDLSNGVLVNVEQPAVQGKKVDVYTTLKELIIENIVIKYLGSDKF